MQLGASLWGDDNEHSTAEKGPGKCTNRPNFVSSAFRIICEQLIRPCEFGGKRPFQPNSPQHLPAQIPPLRWVRLKQIVPFAARWIILTRITRVSLSPEVCGFRTNECHTKLEQGGCQSRATREFSELMHNTNSTARAPACACSLPSN